MLLVFLYWRETIIYQTAFIFAHFNISVYLSTYHEVFKFFF